MRLRSSCDTGSKEIGIPRPDVTSKSESTSQYGPAKISSPKYLDADTNDRRKCGTGESQQSMKIRVRSYDDAPFFSSVV